MSSWSPAFIQAISATEIRPRYLVESVPVGSYKPYGGTLLLSSFPLRPYTQAIVADRSSITYPTLHAGDWRRTFGNMTLGIAGFYDPRRAVTRGSTIALRVGFDGWDVGQFETVWLGQVTDITWNAGLWVLQATDLVAGLTSRFSETSLESPLFHDLASTTINAGPYSGGSPMTVTSTAGFRQDSHTGLYCVQVTRDNGATYLCTATGKNATQFTGVTASVFGTGAAGSAANGNAVEEVAYFADHPIDVVQRVLMSTGNGTNGPFDTASESWGLGIDYGLVDLDDCASFVGRSSPASGSPNWDVIAIQEQTNPLTWLQNIIEPGGFFISQHQGKLTVRAGEWAGITPDAMSVRSDHIVAVEGYETWDGSHAVEYHRVSVADGDGAVSTSTEKLNSRPAINAREIALTRVFSNQANIRAEVRDRTREFWQRVPERLTVRCRGWVTGVMSPGELVMVATNRIQGRDGASFDGRHTIHLGGGPDWFGASSTLNLGLLPYTATET